MRRVWDFFNSVKLTVIIVLAMTAITMFGSLVISSHDEIFGNLDQQLFLRWLFSDGVVNFKYTWWFFALLGTVVLLGINTFVCTVERLPVVIRKYRYPLTNLREIELGGEKGVELELAGGQAGLEDSLKKSGYSVFSDGGRVYAEKNRWLPFVPYIIHIAVLAFMLAHLIGGLYGYRHPGLHINEGETTVAPTGDYQIRLDKVKVEQREDGSLKEYGSLLTAIKDGKEIKKQWVTANKPMFVEGGAIYQRDFGQSFNGLILAVTDKSTGFSNYIVAPKGAMYVKIPGSAYRLRVDRFLAAFELDRNGEPFSNTDELVNPAIFVTVMNGNTPGGSGWVLLREPNMDSLHDPVVDVKLADISMLSYSGFDVNRDPSAGLALIASFTVLFGSCITLYVRRQRVWANIEGGRAQVVCTDEDLYEKLKG